MPTKASDRARLRRRPWLLALLVLVVASACTAVQNAHYQADVSPGHVYIWVYKQPTKQIVLVNDLPSGALGVGCGGDEWCTLRFLRDEVDLNWIAGIPVITDFDEFFRYSNVSDFRGALDDVRGTDRCLLADRNHYPWSDAHNWTSGNPGNGSCKTGQNVAT